MEAGCSVRVEILKTIRRAHTRPRQRCAAVGRCGLSSQTCTDDAGAHKAHFPDSLHPCEESGGLCGPHGPAPPWNSVALEWDADGVRVRVGVCIFWVLTHSQCVEEVGRAHRCEADA